MDGMVVKFFEATGAPTGKLADAELQFTAGPLAGLKLVGFSIWQRLNAARYVSFPVRRYTTDGERRTFGLLRPIADPAALTTQVISTPHITCRRRRAKPAVAGQVHADVMRHLG